MCSGVAKKCEVWEGWDRKNRIKIIQSWLQRGEPGVSSDRHVRGPSAPFKATFPNRMSRAIGIQHQGVRKNTALIEKIRILSRKLECFTSKFLSEAKFPLITLWFNTENGKNSSQELRVRSLVRRSRSWMLFLVKNTSQARQICRWIRIHSLTALCVCESSGYGEQSLVLTD